MRMYPEGFLAGGPVPLQRVSTVDAVVIALRQEVFDGHLPLGQVLREGALCDRFGVSRHSLRMALSALAHEGVLRHEPNRGVFVRTLTEAEIADCFRMRRLLELQAVETICGDKPALMGARRAVEQMVQSTQQRSPWTAVREFDVAFHSALVDALGSRHMTNAYQSLLVELRLCFLVEGFKDKDQAHVAQDHLDLLEALDSGNLAHATRLLSEHMTTSEQDAIAALRSYTDLSN